MSEFLEPALNATILMSGIASLVFLGRRITRVIPDISLAHPPPARSRSAWMPLPWTAFLATCLLLLADLFGLLVGPWLRWPDFVILQRSMLFVLPALLVWRGMEMALPTGNAGRGGIEQGRATDPE